MIWYCESSPQSVGARLTRKYTRVPRGRIYKEITHQNFESVSCSWNSSSWIFLFAGWKGEGQGKGEGEGESRWTGLQTEICRQIFWCQTKKTLLGKFSWPIWFFAWMEVIFVGPKADFSESSSKSWNFSDWNQQILWPVFFSQFISVWPPGMHP